MKRNVLKWIFIAVVMVAGLSACGSSRISPQVGFGVPLQGGRTPEVNFQWYQE